MAVQLPAFVIHNVVGPDDKAWSEDEADPVYEGCQKREVVKVPKRNHYELFLTAVKHFMEQQDKCDMKGVINLRNMMIELTVKRTGGELIGQWLLDGASRNGESKQSIARKPAGPINEW